MPIPLHHLAPVPPPGYQAGTVALADIVITEELERRGARAPDHAAESAALLAFADAMSGAPETLLQLLSDTALRLTRAGSAGISLFEPDENVFRWYATSGTLAHCCGGTLPRDFSPCGVVLDTEATLLMREPARFFPYIGSLNPPVAEVLLVPFYRDRQPVGTIWVVAHERCHGFDLEDERLIASLTRFAAAAMGIRDSLHMLERTQERLREEVARRAASEASFRALIDVSPQIVWSADSIGRFTFINHRWTALTGAAADSSDTGNWGDLIDPKTRERAVEEWTTALQRGVAFELEFALLRSSDRSYRRHVVRAQPIVDATGELRQWVGVAFDIEDRIQLEEHRAAVEGRRNEFLATLAHELRNPLAPLVTGLEILKLTSDPAAVAEVRVAMERQIGHLGRLVDDLLDSARINNGKIALRKSRIEIQTTLDAAVELSLPLIEAGEHRLTRSLRREPIFVDADATRLVQVFSNLLNNAARYTPRGGTIRLVADTDDAGVYVDVIDDGPGIDRDMLPFLFEMYTQDYRSQQHTNGGLGIGLAIVKRLTELHGGTIKVTDNPFGQGSAFRVRLPVAEA